MRKAVIAGSVRTPVGRFLGTLKGLPATDLGARVVRETIHSYRPQLEANGFQFECELPESPALTSIFSV